MSLLGWLRKLIWENKAPSYPCPDTGEYVATINDKPRMLELTGDGTIGWHYCPICQLYHGYRWQGQELEIVGSREEINVTE